ncbi:hypothetical protein Tco_0424697 [Tanacetum coccineum]
MLSPATFQPFRQRHVAGETYPQRNVAGEKLMGNWCHGGSIFPSDMSLGKSHNANKNVMVSLIIQLMYVTMLEGTQARLRGWQQTAVGRESKFFFWNFFDAESHLAFETSGHGATKENHLLNDGAYLMLVQVVRMKWAKLILNIASLAGRSLLLHLHIKDDDESETLSDTRVE